MHELIRLSPVCFPGKVWKRCGVSHDGYAQFDPSESDVIRREAIAAWQLGFCSLRAARATLRRIEELGIRYGADRREALQALLGEGCA